jgi:hypothetical protein
MSYFSKGMSIKMSLSLTKDGLTFTNDNNETKNIKITDATNTIDFEQFNISTTFVSNKEYVGPNNNNNNDPPPPPPPPPPP